MRGKRGIRCIMPQGATELNPETMKLARGSTPEMMKRGGRAAGGDKMYTGARCSWEIGCVIGQGANRLNPEMMKHAAGS
jgi:hypothetical protein